MRAQAVPSVPKGFRARRASRGHPVPRANEAKKGTEATLDPPGQSAPPVKPVPEVKRETGEIWGRRGPLV